MGLFDIFRKAPSKTSPFDSAIKIDLPTLLNNSTFYKEHKSKEGVLNSIEYESPLNTAVLNTFDTIRIRLGSNKKEINKETPIILTFLLQGKNIDTEQAKFVVNQIAKCCKVEDENWTDIDAIRIHEGTWRGRTFFLNENLISIEWDQHEGLTLCITGYQKYL